MNQQAQSSELISRFRQAANRVAPEAMTVATVAVMASNPQALEAEDVEELEELAQGTPAIAMELDEGEIQALQDRAIDEEVTLDTIGYPSNEEVEEPEPSGEPPMMVEVNLTQNTMVWLDASGRPTQAPDELPEDDPIVRFTGDLDERYARAESEEERAALISEPTRVLLSNNPEALDEAMVIQARGAPGDPRGFPRYAEVPTPAQERAAAGEIEDEGLDEVEAERLKALEEELEQLRAERDSINEERQRVVREAERPGRQEEVDEDRRRDEVRSMPSDIADNVAERSMRRLQRTLERESERRVRDSVINRIRDAIRR